MPSSSSKRFVTEYTRDYYGGALMLLIGLVAVFQGMQYGVGNLRQMESGFFPVAVGAILALMGVAIAACARRPSAAEEEDAQPAEWRGWICITSSIVAFLVLGRYGGLLPATFAIVFISALGDRDNSVRSAFLLAAAICVVSVVLFWWALKLQFPLLSWG
jgi:putative tricarboxylic transport membrane protein